jgi:hypothetical protein
MSTQPVHQHGGPRVPRSINGALRAVLVAVVAALCLAGFTAAPASAAPATHTALSWGSNAQGQLGDGATTDRSTPVEVRLPAGVQLTAIAGDGDQGLTPAWGYNPFG